MEDNSAMIQVVKTGKNPTMRCLNRTHRVNIGSLHETAQLEEVEILACPTAVQSAEMPMDSSTLGPLSEILNTAFHIPHRSQRLQAQQNSGLTPRMRRRLS